MNAMKLMLPIIVLLLLVLSTAAYTIDEREQVVITQFGRPIGEPIVEPGLYFKIPFVQQVNVFPKHLLEWDGDPGQIPTKDKTYLWVDTFARWRIVDPLAYFQTVTDERSAQARLDDIIDAAVRNFITSHPLIETVRMTNRQLDTFELGVSDEAQKIEDELEEQKKASHMGQIKVGRREISKGILMAAQPKLNKFGIELVDVKLKRINYVETVRESVYGRMIAERKQIAEKFRSEGRGEASKIEGKMQKELKEIESEAYRKAQMIKGEADAKATAIYADSFGRDPDFYSFIRTMDIYRETIDPDTSLILSTDSELFKYLKTYKE